MSTLEQLQQIIALRIQARHFRDIGMKDLMHAAYRSARMRLRDMRGSSRKVRCYCFMCTEVQPNDAW